MKQTYKLFGGVGGNQPSLFSATLACLLLAGGLIAAVPAQAGTATIGGSVWTGSFDATGTAPNLNPGPGDAITDLDGAVVMVQRMDSGAFVAYGTFTAGTNTWTAVVPAPDVVLDPMDPATWEDYVVMFSAPDHDLTSRAYRVSNGDTVTQDAFLAPLPLPKGRLLAYAFFDTITNGADDFPMDPGLAGVLLEVIDENGQVVMSGVTGSQDPSVIPIAAGPDFNGLYYFTGPTALEPGEYIVRATPPPPPPGASGWYHTTTEEGHQGWEVVVRPNDPGTEAGFYAIWYGFAPKFPSSVDPGNPQAATISGRMIDADGNDPEEPMPPGKPCLQQIFDVPDGYAVLYGLCGDTGPCGPVATVLADPVTGDFAFTDVPPGSYKIFASDVPMEYVFNEQEVTVTANQDITGMEIWMPRFFGRIWGFVKDDLGNPIAGARIVVRLDPGSVWAETISQADGSYLLNALAEVETMGLVEVEPPPGYRAMHVDPDPLDPNRDTSCVARIGKHGNRYVMFFAGLNDHADLFVEPIPAATGDIRGFTYYDAPQPPTWLSDGVWQEYVEPTIEGVTINLLDATGTTVVATTTSAFFDAAGAIAQGWEPPFTAVPMDAWGGVYNGAIPAFYEFRDVAPGDYLLQVVPPLGYVLPPLAPFTVPVTVAAGAAVDLDFGLTTLAPSSGLLAGAVFDDAHVDTNPLSIWFDEKAFIVGAPVTVFDHYGYVIDAFLQPSQWCWPGAQTNPLAPLCDRPDLGPTVEIERRLAPGPHVYLGNDPNHPAFNPNYAPMPLNYYFPQGGAKYEADWSLVPAMMCTLPDGTPVQAGAFCEWPGGNVCIAGTCDGAGMCIQEFTMEFCNDAFFCNGWGVCMGGVCVQQAGNPCSGGPECNNSCNEFTRDCFNPQGTACTDDGDACTDNMCDGAGTCAAVPVVCTALDQCHGAGVCDPATGCSNPALPDGTLCDDADPCTENDACTAGVCSGTTVPPGCGNGCAEVGENCGEPSLPVCTGLGGSICNGTTCTCGGPIAGDVNGDGNINVIDALFVAQYVVGLRDCTTMAEFVMCDVHPAPPDGPDGMCTIVDALKMAQCSVGLIPCDFVPGPVACP